MSHGSRVTHQTHETQIKSDKLGSDDMKYESRLRYCIVHFLSEMFSEADEVCDQEVEQ